MKRFKVLAFVAAIALAACSVDSPSKVFTPGDPDSEDRAEDLALDHVTSDPGLAGLGDLYPERVAIDDLGQAHVWLQQTINNVPVFGGQLIVHLDDKGKVRFERDKLSHKVKVDTDPVLSDWQATDLAVANHGGWSIVTGVPTADLQILEIRDTAFLTWRVQIRQIENAADPSLPVVFIDADSGNELMWYDDLAEDLLDDSPVKVTFDVGNTTNKSTAPIADSSDAVALAAHTHAGLTLDYYASIGRASFDDKGGTVESYVHYDTNYVNAYWDGSNLTFGDGDGVTSDPLVTLDIVAHEFSHGVTDYSADLTYRNESGALNEGNSDIMAAAVEAAQGDATFDSIWLVGEDCWLEAPSLRTMYDPAASGDRDYYWDRYTGSSDNGGVHTNSGIANLFFYLLSEGGTHPRGKSEIVVAGVGIDKAAAIWYRALTNYFGRRTDFADAMADTIAAAEDLYGTGSAEAQAVQDAWNTVGVGVPEPPPPPPAVYDTPIDSLSGLSGDKDSETVYGPYDASSLVAIKFDMNGPGGKGPKASDADLYVKFGSAPTTGSYDCRPYISGNTESCEFNPSDAGDYYVMIRGFTAYTDVSLAVTGASGAPPDCSADGTCNALCEAGADPDCGGDTGGTCQIGAGAGQQGDSCTDDTDCSSCSCKGKPNGKTCK